jgi:hypothetical protein
MESLRTPQDPGVSVKISGISEASQNLVGLFGLCWSLSGLCCSKPADVLVNYIP